MLFTNALQTDRLTNRQMDTAYYRDARTHLKTCLVQLLDLHFDPSKKEKKLLNSKQEDQQYHAGMPGTSSHNGNEISVCMLTCTSHSNSKLTKSNQPGQHL